jgi:YVTN family beta-propeller protein
MQQRFVLLAIIICSVFCATSCKHKQEAQVTPTDNSNFPPAVAAIFVNRCATAGCHNSASYQNADSLLLDNWADLFKGSEGGAEVVPYNTQFSSLLYYINTDSSLGTVALPAMPLDSPLTKDEYMTIYNWIADGAKDANGNVPFASNPDTRQKIYLTQQGCDLLAVIDAQSKLIMRYIPIGVDPNVIESPHCVRVSDDGMHAYVSFLNGNYIQQIDTRTDQVTRAVNIGSVIPGGSGGSWNIVFLSPNVDTALITSDWQGNGLVATVNTTNMQIETNKTEEGSGLFIYPHGITSNATFDTFFVTAQYGNIVYEISLKGGPFYKQISLDGNPPTAAGTDSNLNDPNPHQILMAPDYSKYFVTCQSTNEVRVLDAHTNAVLAAIPVGVFPQEMAISTSKHYLFVTCMEDPSPTFQAHGSVYVIDYTTMQIVSKIYGDFYQPHGITVDEQDGLVYIASTNANPDGPAPHHVTSCGGRDGWYTVYNLNTLQPVSTKRYEVTVMPYSAATRFH